MITTEQLSRCAIYLKDPKLTLYTGLLNTAMDQFGISSLDEQQQFLAQVMHESGECRYTLELASGTAYEGRKDLGNTEPGDGVKYKGRGLIQITGKNNYKLVGDALGLDLVNNPEILQEAEPATNSAAWYWQSHKLNQWADMNTISAFEIETRRINGGINGEANRQAYWDKFKEVYTEL